MNSQVSPRMISVTEAAKYLGVSRTYIFENLFKMVDQYGVKYTRFGRKIVFEKESLDRMLDIKMGVGV